MVEPEPKRWRKWLTRSLTLTIAQIALAGTLLMAYGFGRMLRATNQLDASVMTLDASIREVGTGQEKSSERLERQTQILIAWTKLLFVVTGALCILTVVLLVVTWHRP
jgi:hypothetical protein